jgi:transcriptional regulator with XRE-family HTH domain
MKFTHIKGNEDLAAVLTALREREGKTPGEVCRETEIFHDSSHVGKIERGQNQFRTIDKLVEYLDYFGCRLAVIYDKKK